MKRDEVARLVRILGPIVMFTGSTLGGGKLPILVTKCGTGCRPLSPAHVKLSRMKWTVA